MGRLLACLTVRVKHRGAGSIGPRTPRPAEVRPVEARHPRSRMGWGRARPNDPWYNSARTHHTEVAMPNVTIQWFAGRTDQQRREITVAITDALVRIGKTTADQVHIVFQDVEKNHWGYNGKLTSD